MSLYAVRLRLYVIVVHMLSSFSPSYVVLHMLLYVVHTLSYTICLCSYVVVRTSSYIVRCPSSFIRHPRGNVPRNILENSLLVKDKKDERYKKTRLGPK
jgi:hypothetical protein